MIIVEREWDIFRKFAVSVVPTWVGFSLSRKGRVVLIVRKILEALTEKVKETLKLYNATLLIICRQH